MDSEKPSDDKHSSLARRVKKKKACKTHLYGFVPPAQGVDKALLFSVEFCRLAGESAQNRRVVDGLVHELGHGFC
jgi:hypothetical protein